MEKIFYIFLNLSLICFISLSTKARDKTHGVQGDIFQLKPNDLAETEKQLIEKFKDKYEKEKKAQKGYKKKVKIDFSNTINFLFSAARAGEHSVVTEIVKLSKNYLLLVDAETGNTLLHEAVKENPYLTKDLIRLGANVYALNKKGETPLHISAKYGRVSSTQHLIDVIDIKSELSRPDKNKDTPLHLVMSKHEGKFVPVEMREILIEMLVKAGADINAKTKLGHTVLYYACERGEKNLVRLLINLKADVNIANRWGNTPLHAAALHSQRDTMRILIENKANIHAVNNNKQHFLDFYYKADPYKIRLFLTSFSSQEQKRIQQAFKRYSIRARR